MYVEEARAALATMVRDHWEVSPTLKVAQVKEWLLGEITSGGLAGEAGTILKANHLDREAEKIVMAELVDRTAPKVALIG